MAVKIKLGLDNSTFKKGMKTAGTSAKRFADKVEQSGKLSKASLLGIGASLAGVVLSVKNLIAAYAVQEQAEKRLEAALLSSGNAASISSEELKTYASELQGISKFGDEATLSAQALFLTIAGETNVQNTKNATLAIANMAAAMGTDMTAAARAVGLALKDPATGISLMRRQGILFTDAEKEKIQVLIDSGNQYKAQAFILSKINNQFKDQARLTGEGTGSLTSFTNAVGDIKEEMGKLLIDALAPTLKTMTAFLRDTEKIEQLKRFALGIVKLVGAFLAFKVAVIGTSTAITFTRKAMLLMKAPFLMLRTNFTKARTGALAMSKIMKGKVPLSLKSAKIAVRGLGAAVKGLVGATGIGLLVVFLPEVIEFAKKAFFDLNKTVNSVVDNMSKVLGGFGTLLKGVFTLDRDAISKGWDNIKEGFTQFGKDMDDIQSAMDDQEDKRLEERLKKKSAVDEGAYDSVDVSDEEIARLKKQIESKKKAETVAEMTGEKTKATALDKFLDQQRALRLARGQEISAADLERLREKYESATVFELELAAKKEAALLEADLIRREGDKIAKEEIIIEDQQRQNKIDKKFLKDRQRFGATFAKMEKLRQSDQYKASQQFLGSYASLQDSENSKLKSIGKASAISQIGIDTAQSALSIFAKLNAAFPFLAPAIGAAGAIPITLKGKEQVQKVKAARTGGLVTREFGTPSVGDHQPFLLEAGENIQPKDDVKENRKVNKLILEKLSSDPEEQQQTGGEIEVNIGIQDEASSMIFADNVKNMALGIGVRA